MKTFSEYLNEATMDKITFRVAEVLGKDGMTIMGNNQQRVNTKDILGAFTTANFGARLVLKPTEWTKKLGKRCFRIYSFETKAISTVKIDENCKMHFTDHYKEDEETPVFSSNGVVIRDLVAIVPDLKEYSDEKGDTTPAVSLEQFKKTEFGKMLF